MTVNQASSDLRAKVVRRALIGAIAFATTLAVGIQIAHSAEIVPSCAALALHF